jgi:hypothetical protein
VETDAADAKDEISADPFCNEKSSPSSTDLNTLRMLVFNCLLWFVIFVPKVPLSGAF